MDSCLCTIFDTREERLVEDDGRITYRLICNICGSVLDSREEHDRRACKKTKTRTPGQREGDIVAF